MLQSRLPSMTFIAISVLDPNRGRGGGDHLHLLAFQNVTHLSQMMPVMLMSQEPNPHAVCSAQMCSLPHSTAGGARWVKSEGLGMVVIRVDRCGVGQTGWLTCLLPGVRALFAICSQGEQCSGPTPG